MEFDFSIHAKEQMTLRGISQDEVKVILQSPQQVIYDSEISEIEIYQSIFKNLQDQNYLIRVFVNRTKNPKLVVTVYKTSKILKYWKDESNL
jgi:hypothetical protein